MISRHNLGNKPPSTEYHKSQPALKPGYADGFPLIPNVTWSGMTALSFSTRNLALSDSDGMRES